MPCEPSRMANQLDSDQLMQAIYPDLRNIARARLRRSGHLTLLETTSLINETWLRLNEVRKLTALDKPYFLAYAARAMRSVVVDYARSRNAERHSGRYTHIELDAQCEATNTNESQLLQVHEALHELEKLEPRLAQIVELRYFGGLSEEDIASFLGIARRTVQRDWIKARALLFDALR